LKLKGVPIAKRGGERGRRKPHGGGTKNAFHKTKGMGIKGRILDENEIFETS